MLPENETPITEQIMDASCEVMKFPTLKENRDRLIFLINQLIIRDFDSLIQLLYRIDVNEKKLKEALAKNKSNDAAAIITQLIIERQIQKKESRKHFRSDEDFDEERW